MRLSWKKYTWLELEHNTDLFSRNKTYKNPQNQHKKVFCSFCIVVFTTFCHGLFRSQLDSTERISTWWHSPIIPSYSGTPHTWYTGTIVWAVQYKHGSMCTHANTHALGLASIRATFSWTRPNYEVYSFTVHEIFSWNLHTCMYRKNVHAGRKGKISSS